MAKKDQTTSPEDFDNDVDDSVDTNDNIKVDLSYLGSRDDNADSRTVASRQRLREQLTADVEAFLARGGKIDRVEADVTADPPKRPESNYGQRPI